MDTMTILGNRISELRKVRKIAQEEMANRIGIEGEKYKKLESGKSNIGLNILSKVATELGVSVKDITKVLDVMPEVGETTGSVNKDVADMLEVFYANKRMYEKLTGKEE